LIIITGSSAVRILQANYLKAFDALCVQQEAGHPRLQFTEDSFEGAMEELHWEVTWGNGDVVNLTWQNPVDDEDLMNDTLAVIAPFVESGSYLTFITGGTLAKTAQDTVYYYFLGGRLYCGPIERMFEVLSAARAACGENGWRMVLGEPNPHDVMLDKLSGVLGAGAEVRLIPVRPETPPEPAC
jgi:hypothetical protein